MTKEEFLIQLREYLEGQVSNEELADSLAFYRSYFMDEENNGKTEEEILKSLGNPRLIAHSIIDAQEEGEKGQPTGYYDVEDDTYQDENDVPMNQKVGYLMNRIGGILFMVIALLVGIFALRLLLPIIVVIIIFIFLSNLFRGQ
ncbi:MAG: DUF1700 domain-containing protein [Eubacteriales bacterium]|nr:DUF1700 domain-containing protein [Eubacteriales bacterium]